MLFYNSRADSKGKLKAIDISSVIPIGNQVALDLLFTPVLDFSIKAELQKVKSLPTSNECFYVMQFPKCYVGLSPSEKRQEVKISASGKHREFSYLQIKAVIEISARMSFLRSQLMLIVFETRPFDLTHAVALTSAITCFEEAKSLGNYNFTESCFYQMLEFEPCDSPNRPVCCIQTTIDTKPTDKGYRLTVDPILKWPRKARSLVVVPYLDKGSRAILSLKSLTLLQ
mmetsp:Transcript_13512/g.25410  ORF Transcript_13512/g.25410 Transcript_13512/m.25410 type:complete len:228 (-) Transcript_13512:197-880(-)